MALPKDDFNRPDQNGIGTASDGGTWSVQLPAECNIIDGKLQTVTSDFTSNYVRRQVTGAPSEYEIAVDIYRPEFSNGCTLRMGVLEGSRNDSAAGEEYYLELDSNGGDCTIVRRSGGAYVSTLFSMATWGTPSGPAFSRITFRRSGSVLTAIQDGTQLGTWTDTTPLPETYWIGWDSSRTTERMDNFNVQPVAMPTPVTLSGSPSGLNITLSWTGASGATSFRLYRGDSLIYQGAATSFTDTVTQYNTSYTYTVIASNAAGESRDSAIVHTGLAPNPSTAVNVSGPTARLQIYEPDGTTLIAIVPRRKALSWLDEINAPGTGKFDIHLYDPLLEQYPNLLDEFNVCKIFLDGIAVKAFLIEDVSPTRLSSGELADNWVSVTGRGIMAVLENAVVYPEYGLREYVSEDRNFNFASRDGVWRNTAEWVGVSGHKWRDDATTKKGYPKDWPDPDAYWLWSTNTQLNAQPGPNWFRTEFTTASTQAVTVKASADNDFVCYLDGELILTNGANNGAFRETYEWSMMLPSGDHTIAAQVINGKSDRTDIPNANPGGWIFVIYRANELLEATADIVLRSNISNTIVKPYGEAPGFAGAMILLQLVVEAQARYVQGTGSITFSFTNTLDSAGQPWDDVQDRIVKVGTTDYLDVAAQLIELVMDIDIDPNLVLHAWKRRGTDKRNTVILRPDNHLTAAAGTIRASKLRNQALLKYEFGWMELYAAISKEVYGRREVGISLGTATSPEQTELAGKATLREVANPEKTIPMSYTSARGKQPYKDFGLGDTITVPDVYSGMVPARLMSVAATEEETGVIAWDLDFYPETADDVIDSVVIETGGAYDNPSTLYQQQVISDSPWAYHRFKEPGPDDGGDIYMYDASGKGRFFTIRHPAGTGGPLYNQTGPVDKAMLFSNLVAQYGESPQGNSDHTFMQGIATLECWVRVLQLPDSTKGTYSPILCFSQGVDHTTHDKEILLHTDGRIVFYVSQPPARTAHYLPTPSALVLNRWYHVACSIGPEGHKIYLDGVKVAHDINVTSANVDRAMTLYLRASGAGHNNQTSRIEIAETAAYGQQLFDSRIKSHWDAAGYKA